MSCGLCDAVHEERVVCVTEFSFCMIGLHAAKVGHVMVLPKRHVVSVEDLNEKEAKDFLGLVGKIKNLINSNFEDPCVVIQNTGKHSTQPHIHFHMLPMKEGARSMVAGIDKCETYPKRSMEELIDFKEKIKKLF